MNIYIPKNVNDLTGLPDWFDYSHYLRLSKETDLSRWAYEFVNRINNISHEQMLNETRGIRYNEDGTNIKTIWKRGVLTGSLLYNHNCNNYIDTCHLYYLKEFEGEFIPDSKKAELYNLNDYEVNTTMQNPIKEAYEKYFSISGRTYFKSRDSFMEYQKKINTLTHRTASFLVNLEMPTYKIIKEIEAQLIQIKKRKSITEIDLKKQKAFDTWAMGLGCFDLIKGGVRPAIIKRKYLHYCYYGEQKDDNSPILDSDNNNYNTVTKSVEHMINGGWKELVGNPV